MALNRSETLISANVRLVKSRHVSAHSRRPLSANSGHQRLFDHFVGESQQFRRDREPERLCGLHVDHQLEPGRLLDRQISRFGALQYFVDVGSGEPSEPRCSLASSSVRPPATTLALYPNMLGKRCFIASSASSMGAARPRPVSDEATTKMASTRSLVIVANAPSNSSTVRTGVS